MVGLIPRLHDEASSSSQLVELASSCKRGIKIIAFIRMTLVSDTLRQEPKNSEPSVFYLLLNGCFDVSNTRKKQADRQPRQTDPIALSASSAEVNE